MGDPYPSSIHVVATVTIANLSDDNGDGKTNAQDVPDLVFPSTDLPSSSTGAAVIRVVDGRCNDDGTMKTLAAFHQVEPTAPLLDAKSAIAVGNLDPVTATTERAPELVLTLQDGRIAAASRLSSDATSWEIRWVSNVPVNQGVGVQPSIADLDGNGSPEIIAGKAIINGQTGALIHAGTGGQGGAGFGAVSTVANLIPGGGQYVIAGNNAFDISGTELFSSPIPDGYTAVANFNEDAYAEVVHVEDGVVRALDIAGTELFNVSIPGGGRGGPPTIADFDADGKPEIAIVAKTSVSVIDFECRVDPLPAECQSTGIRWSSNIQEFSSGGQSSGAFDLDGDGSAEIFFLDETHARILGGSDGQVVFEQAYPSTSTWFQYPTMADIDADGRSELVVPVTIGPGTPVNGGVHVWSAPDWLPSRGIWNQYSYHITNIDNEGQIPPDPVNNWEQPGLNNFRTNSLTLADSMFADGFEPCAIYMWPTQSWFSGDLGGRVGADALCSTDYQAGPDLGCANVHSFISVSANDEIRDMPDNYGVPAHCVIKRLDGAPIAKNWGVLLDGSNTILNPISPPGGATGNFWSGTYAASPDGSLAQHCTGWTSRSGGGSIGYLASTTIFNGGLLCSATRRLSCICW